MYEHVEDWRPICSSLKFFCSRNSVGLGSDISNCGDFKILYIHVYFILVPIVTNLLSQSYIPLIHVESKHYLNQSKDQFNTLRSWFQKYFIAHST